MPEGDTVHKIASFLSERLVGEELVDGRVKDRDWRFRGRRVREVSAHGKHLFLSFDDGNTLRSHLGMWGSWHRYAPGESWRKPAWQATIELHTPRDVWVCFNAHEVEQLRTGGIPDRRRRARLGPDLIEDADAEEGAVARARDLLPRDTAVLDVLLDQRVAAGIGNVYKCEVLFLHGVHPLRRLADVSDDTVRAMFGTAARLLRANLGAGPRVTRDGRGAGLWVYGRRGLPCHRCGQLIRYERAGKHWRDTYWCPGCQPPSG